MYNYYIILFIFYLKKKFKMFKTYIDKYLIIDFIKHF